MKYLIVNALLVLLLPMALKPVKNKNSSTYTHACLEDSYGRQYPIGFHTTFGGGRNVDHRLHMADSKLENEFQEFFDEPIFEIHCGDDGYYIRKHGQDVEVLLERGEQEQRLGDRQHRLASGEKINVHLSIGCDLEFVFMN